MIYENENDLQQIPSYVTLLTELEYLDVSRLPLQTPLGNHLSGLSKLRSLSVRMYQNLLFTASEPYETFLPHLPLLHTLEILGVCDRITQNELNSFACLSSLRNLSVCVSCDSPISFSSLLNLTRLSVGIVWYRGTGFPYGISSNLLSLTLRSLYGSSSAQEDLAKISSLPLLTHLETGGVHDKIILKLLRDVSRLQELVMRDSVTQSEEEDDSFLSFLHEKLSTLPSLTKLSLSGHSEDLQLCRSLTQLEILSVSTLRLTPTLLQSLTYLTRLWKLEVAHVMELQTVTQIARSRFPYLSIRSVGEHPQKSESVKK
jgi:hypothetical protein